MTEPSHEPCPMCGVSDENERITDVNELADQAINNLKFLNLGFMLGYFMTDLERTVYYHHQICAIILKRLVYHHLVFLLNREIY